MRCDRKMYLLRVLRFLLILIELSRSLNVAPVSPVIIYDVVELPDVFGQADIAITGYTGTPSSVTFDPFPLHYTMAYADNKFTFKVHPTFKQLSENNVIKTTASIQLTDNVDSQADILFEFYKIDIETSPKVTKGDQVNIVYEETMDEEERNATAFTCTFVDKEGNGALVGDSVIKHLTSTDIMATNSTEMLTVEFRDLEHMEEEPELDDEGNEILKVEEYECRYKFTYRGATEEFKRHFVVTLDPDGRNWGGIIAACVIAGIIILLCIFFIIYRCCCVKRKRKEKQIPPDLVTSRKAVQETNLSSPETHPKFNDAVNFLDNVQTRFEKQPDIYRTFLTTLTEYRSKKITKPELARKVQLLFEGHPDLVTGFNEFLKSKKKSTENQNEYEVVDLQVTKNPAAIDSDKETAENAPSPESHPKFNAATQFVDQVQSRFVDQPEVYKTFLKMLNDFKPKKMTKADLRAEVNVLFDGHPDLIEGFNDFISSKKKKQQPENEHVVVDIQGKKNGEVHSNKATGRV